jgi:hypothetical protein
MGKSMATDMTPPPGAADFLDAAGWGNATVAPLAGDASFRRYFRVSSSGRVAVLMDAPPPHEDPRPFLTVAGWLLDRRLRPPTILASDVERGLVLLEDFGNDRMREAIEARPETEARLYAQAVDVLVALRAHPAGPFAPYDEVLLQREAALFLDWYCPAVGIVPDRAGYAAAWAAVLDHACSAVPVTVLRDYHAENLMLAGEDLGLLDFQDALAGHPAYDLVSLLQDARRDVDPALETEMLARYRTATGEGAPFLDAYHVLGAQRSAKIIGIFTRLWKRDGKSRYPALCPRVWAYLERDLAQPVLAPVARWFANNVPPDKRGDPMAMTA